MNYLIQNMSAISIHSSPSERHFYFTGTADHSFLPVEKRVHDVPLKDQNLSIKVSAPGYKTRLVEALVPATYSTYIEINLDK